MSRIRQVIDTLEAEQSELRARLAWLDAQLKAFHEHEGTVGAARSVGRRTVERATSSPAARRVRTGDTKARITEFLRKHPGSTAGEVSRGLDMNRGSVSTRLTQLAKLGEITKSERGYSSKPDGRRAGRAGSGQ